MADASTKIALIGYGSMGREIEKIAENRNIVITDIFDIDSKIMTNKKYDFDVAVDFSYPEFLIENLEAIAGLKKNIVIGTTGWYDRIDEVEEIVKSAGIGCVYGSNFSIGMQMYLKIIEFASELMNKIPDYDIFVHEIHHKRKKDSPSGSALTIAQTIIDKVEAKTEIETGRQDGRISPESLHVSSTRGGEITGTHSVFIDSIADTLELTHRAKNRSGFASGAISAAKWINNKTGFYRFDEMLTDIWKESK